MIEVPGEMVEERAALIAEIHAAFEGVMREGGVSWSESEVVDDFGTDEERAAARAEDTDRCWTELAYDADWNIGPASGGWSFLDPIGFQYYLPAAMIRRLVFGADAFGSYDLDTALKIHDVTDFGATAADTGSPDFLLGKPDMTRKEAEELHDGVRNEQLRKISLLNERQCRCIARFIRFMIAWDRARGFDDGAWQRVYDSFWRSVEA